MVVTVSAKNYNLINACENALDWVGESPIDQSGFYKEGSQCVGFTVRGNGNNDITDAVAEDLSGIVHLHLWFMSVVIAEFNWMQFIVSDGVNTGYYNLLHPNDYAGGWMNLVLDLSRAVDAGTKPNMAVITSIGFRLNHTGVAKNAENTWFDHIYTADGLIAYGDDGGSEFDIDDVWSADDSVSNGWGIMTKFGGVYYGTGSLTLGDGVGINACDFQDLSNILIFEERLYNGGAILINSALYDISCVGNATGTTSIKFGDKAGTAGVSGTLIKAIDADRPFTFTATDTDVETLGLYGAIFDTYGVMDFMVNSSTREILNCTFTNGQGQVQPNTMTFEYNNIVGALATLDAAVLMESTSHNFAHNNFIDCEEALEIDTAATHILDADQFINCTYDINNTSGSSITVQNTGTPIANADSYAGSTVTFETTVYLRIYAKDKSTGLPIQNVQTAIYRTSDDQELMNEDTTATGLAEETYNYTGDAAIYYRLRKGSPGATRYKARDGTGTITATGFTITVLMEKDPQQV